jgi:hypothetical protein
MRGLAVRLLAALSLSAAAACGVDTPSSEVTLGTAVLTYHDPAANFGSYTTYAIVSQLSIYQEITGQPSVIYQPAPEILGAVEANLNARGYVKVASIDPANPTPPPAGTDLAVVVAALQGVSYIFYPCDWWPGWGYPGTGCDLPYEFIPYRTGALLIELGDLKNAAATAPNIRIPWSAVAYAVLTPEAATNTQKAVDAVNQAFEQSPYLHTP